MSNNSYSVEYAKSNRSKCKKCKVNIQKDEIRIMVEIPGDSFNTTQSYHPTCFSLPRKYMTGSTKISVETFIESYVEDKTGGLILPSKVNELVTAIESKAPTSSNNNNKTINNNEENDGSIAIGSVIHRIKNAYKAQEAGKVYYEPPPQKKSKNNHNEQKQQKKDDKDDGKLFQKQIGLYGKYYKYTNDCIKDILGYNRQVKTGTKEYILMKLIDGIVYGRLARCPLCTGRLKLHEDDGITVTCNGTFEETLRIRMDCSYKCTTATAPRYQPWYMEEPSDEANDEMDRLEAEAKGESSGSGSGADNDQVIARIIKLSKTTITNWNLNNRDGLRTAAQDIVTLLTKDAKMNSNTTTNKVIDIPTDSTHAMQRIGQLISTNREKTFDEIIPLLVNEFGFVQDKKMAMNKKKQSIENSVKNSANVPIVAAFQELAELYFKTGNANAGSSYIKVVKVLSDLSYPVTITNANGLAKGKTKVPNIGKSSADKIYEFCSTGTIQKLEEKRADAAA